MFCIDNPKVKNLLLKGNIGLEKEGLRVLESGYLALSAHPLKDVRYVTRDFAENQLEINTKVLKSEKEAINELNKQSLIIHKKLASMSEYLWPFSNPPYIRDENDLPIAKYEEKDAHQRKYREHLSDIYGRYKMSFCGIHYNYSFCDELLEEDFSYKKLKRFKEYKNALYMDLAKKMEVYGWIITAVTAASPIVDSSFLEKGKTGDSRFLGMASLRCSEIGYWNHFTPLLDYSDIYNYVKSVKRYVNEGYLSQASELYYPIRLKPAGINSLDSLEKNGIDHIELRMIDINPLESAELNLKDLVFAKLLMVWLACSNPLKLKKHEQIMSIQNFKNAAYYDLDMVNIFLPDMGMVSARKAGIEIIEKMEEFFKEDSGDIKEVLLFEKEKFLDAKMRYSSIIYEKYRDDYVKKGIILAKKRQEEIIKKECFITT
ncbi:glutamate--cysteine ligase [Acetitomaculum ruminis DSM 5522]|uniref:Glutamate--cysteine ligase n=1 Tax=Acetitomaculum ruminis DSM 5522 TaxID=1120918 RepID=A0A1I0ZYC6_9FIRM|nr:hypothetical protein [Acetitomaculum ruminis]SFB30076.1 glutamate--cysteine ligase [Acetitomaculum ruminis DSM 5522]